MITKDSKVLITGCGGMLGEAVYGEFFQKCIVLATDIDLNEPWLKMLDVRNKDEVIRVVNEFNPDYIIHLAALTDMEYCEKNLDNAYQTNTLSVLYLSREATKRNIPFLFISTAGIFDGEQNFYKEDDLPNPLSVYGRTKYLGELLALSIKKSIVIRAGWMMGGGPKKDKKFVNKIISQLKSGKKDIFALEDKLGVPCYTYDLARSIYYLLDQDLYGLYHGACEGNSSRYDVAEHMLHCLDTDGNIKLHKVTSDFFKKDYFAPRPYSEQLVNTALKQINPALTRDWRVCLEEYLAKFNWGLDI